MFLKLILLTIFYNSLITNQAFPCPIMGLADQKKFASFDGTMPFSRSSRAINSLSRLEPAGSFIDRKGYSYLIDSEHHRVKVLNPKAEVVRLIGGKGTNKGEFFRPKGLALDHHGNIYVADTGNDRIQKFSSQGLFIKQWGSYGYRPEQLIEPTGMTVLNNEVYVSDSGRKRIAVFNLTGQFQYEIKKISSTDQWALPYALTNNHSNTVIAADLLLDKLIWIKNRRAIRDWGIRGALPGQMMGPISLSYKKDRILIGEMGNHRIQQINHDRKILKGIGPSYIKTDVNHVRLHYPAVIAHSEKEGVSINCQPLRQKCFFTNEISRIFELEDSLNWDVGPTSVFYKRTFDISKDIVAVSHGEHQSITIYQRRSKDYKLIESFGTFGSKLGQFRGIHSIALSPDASTLYVADAFNHRVQVFTRDQNSKFRFKIAFGSFGSGPFKFNRPGKIEISQDHELLIHDQMNSRIKIYDSSLKLKAIIPTESNITKAIGRQVQSFSYSDHDKILALIDPYEQIVRKLTLKGQVRSTIGQRRTSNRKKMRQQDRFIFAYDIASFRDGGVAITDTATQKIKIFNSSGELVSTVGGPIEFYKPQSIRIDRRTNDIYVLDYGHDQLKVFDQFGKMINRVHLSQQHHFGS